MDRSFCAVEKFRFGIQRYVSIIAVIHIMPLYILLLFTLLTRETFSMLLENMICNSCLMAHHEDNKLNYFLLII